MSTIPRRLGKYELQGCLGRGGMAEVWKAFDTELERYVAIKIMRADLQNDPDFMKRFVREAQAVAALHHPNIVQVHDFQTAPAELDRTSAYMVMDYIEGQTLTEFIHQTSRIGKFPPASEIVYLFARICSAVDYAHQHGMIHRDIKPANILLDKSGFSRYAMGTPFLTDFGIVKLVGTSTVTQTHSGGWLGTPLYISPEQALGHPGNERSDIYSLGVILYEICTGVRPFQGEHIGAIIMQHIYSPPTLPALINPQVTPALTEVIMQALAKDPAVRFPTASSMAATLAGAFQLPSVTPVNPLTPVAGILNEHVSQSQMPPVVTPSNPQISSPPSSTPRPRRAGRIAALIALVLLFAAGSSTGIFYFASHRGSGSTGTPVVTNQSVGYAAFVNSGLFNADNSQGVEDELQVSLQHIPDPAPGKSYYAWLLSDTNQQQMSSIFLQKLSISNGSASFIYKEAQHNNLLGTYSRFLITEENANAAPVQPSTDRHNWRYYAEIPQTVDSSSGFTDPGMLYYLRNLLYLNHNLAPAGTLTIGGGAIWLLRNTQRVLDEANNALLSWKSRDAKALRGYLANTLAYIDGSTNIRQDLPAAPSNVTVAAALYQTGLINPYGPNYQSQIDYNLGGIFQSSSTPRARSALANNADIALDSNVHDWLQKVHDDAKQLIDLTDQQLLQSQTLLNDMLSQAGYAYHGKIDPSSGKVQQQGVLQIYASIQSLATLDLKPTV